MDGPVSSRMATAVGGHQPQQGGPTRSGNATTAMMVEANMPSPRGAASAPDRQSPLGATTLVVAATAAAPTTSAVPSGSSNPLTATSSPAGPTPATPAPTSMGAAQHSEGWLYKKGRIHKNWKRRWMALRGNQLHYFTQPHLKDSAAKGSINLEGAEITRPDAAMDASSPEQPPSGTGGLLFLIKTSKGRIYMLKAEQDKDVDVWMARLQAAARIKTNTAWPDARLTSPPASPKLTAGGAIQNLPRKGKKGVKLYKRYLGTNDKKGRVFGILLEELVRREATDFGIPIVIYRIIMYLDQVLQVQGIFRLSGGAESVRQLKKAFDQSKDQWSVPLPEDRNSGPHSVASLLKLFMKELPDPLVPDAFYKPFLDLQKQRWNDTIERLRALRDLIFKMPPAHRAMIAALSGLLQRMAKHCQVNQMTPKNLAICLAPNIFRSNDLNLIESMTDAPYLLSIMKTFITQHAFLFAKEENLDLICPERKSGAPVMIPLGGNDSSVSSAMFNQPRPATLQVPLVKSWPAASGQPVDAPIPSFTTSSASKPRDFGSFSDDTTVLEVEEFLYDEEILDVPGTQPLGHEELLAATQAFIDQCMMSS